MFQRLHLILFCASLILINACTEENPVPLSPITLTPLPAHIIEGDCERVGDFENWLQALEFRRQTFTDFIEQSSEKQRTQLQPELVRLGDLAVLVAETPALACGEEVHQAILSGMQSTLDNFQAYVNGDRDDLSTVIAESRQSFDKANAAMAELITELENRLRNE